MTSSRISYHVHSTFTPDRARLKTHVSTIRPHFILMSGEPEFAKEIQLTSPTTNVIWRNGGDQYAYQQQSPEEWLNKRSAEVPGSYLYTSDETPITKEAIDRHLKVMELAAQRGIKLCVVNFGAGQPQPHDWALIRPVIDMLNAHRDLFVMGLREYASGVITSGVIGGDPSMIRPESWPKDVSNTPLWHMGRYRNLMSYCAQEGIQTPRLVITHHGFERLNDIAGWLDSLEKTPPFNQIRGWLSLTGQWMSQDWFAMNYSSAEEAYFQQLLWANNVLYEPFSAVEAQMIYSWGAAGSEEQTLDISQAFTFQEKLEAYANTQPDYRGFTGMGSNQILANLPDADKAAILAGFEKAIAAGFLEGSTASSLSSWLRIIKSV